MPTLISLHADYQNGQHFVGKSETGHSISMDSAAVGMPTAGPTPMETVLQAAAVCSAMDVVAILKKRKKQITSFELEAQGSKRDSFPRIYTSIHITYKVRGPNITQEEVEKAVKMSHETYCSVINMLKPTVEVSYAVEVSPGQ